MTQYNSLNVELSNSQLNKLKSAIKRLSSNMTGDNETNLPHKLLLTNRQVILLKLLIGKEKLLSIQKILHL